MARVECVKPEGGGVSHIWFVYLGNILVNVKLFGRKFTWFHVSEIAMSRLHRVLILVGWEEEYG